MNRLLLTLPLVLLACKEADLPVPQPGEVACPAPDLQGYLGEPEAAVSGIGYSGVIRVIHPGDAITQDYSPARLNVDIGEDGRIARLWCG